ncbi:prostaglandin E2 receptor EP2 subtype-like [Symphorus nematophorus]
MAQNSSQNCSGIVQEESVTSAVMFSAGLVGNIVALVLLRVRRVRSSPSLYPVLVTALLLTDLLGSICVSPVVLTAYARRKTLVEMSMAGELCSYFGFSMTFLSLSTLSILSLMALERYLSIGQPYFYERHLSTRCGYVTLAGVYLGSVLFCVFPFLGFGAYVQYCPGTWCFLKMNHSKDQSHAYICLYASFILILTCSTVLLNISVIRHLLLMDWRHRRSGASARSRYRRSLSMTEEVEHLLPLAIITVVFICCTFPLVLRVYINITASKADHIADLCALRLISFHSIINPWVFIILRPSALKVLWRKFSKSTLISALPRQTGGRPCCADPQAGN